MGMFLPLSHRLEVRAQVVQAFLAKFQLSPEEMATLRGARDAPITEVIDIELPSFFSFLLCSCRSVKFESRFLRKMKNVMCSFIP